jgi:hypothetical protein
MEIGEVGGGFEGQFGGIAMTVERFRLERSNGIGHESSLSYKT